jgi:hypothetical protein
MTETKKLPMCDLETVLKGRTICDQSSAPLLARLLPSETIMTAKFRSGQTVRLSRNLRYRWAGGEYKVIRQLPESGGELRYCIKSVREPHERVVREDDLEKA